MSDRNRKRALIALLGAVLIWSSTYVSTKQAMSQVPPTTLAFIRFALASLVLFPFYLRDPGCKQPIPWRALALLGFTGAFLYFALQNWGLYYTSVSAGSLIQGGIPVIIALLSIVFLGERINTYRAAGILLAIAGVVGIVFLGGEVQGGSRPILGNLLMLGSSLAWGAYTILNKRFNLNISPVTATLATFLYGLVFMLPFVVMEMRGFNFTLSWLTVANVLYLGIVAMALPIFLWNYALLYYDASDAGLFINLVPVVSVISAMLFLGERVNAGQLAAGGVVILGVLVSSGFGIVKKRGGSGMV
ncbi:MAG: DMT family transporter [Desulfotomaculaceae bacterium]